MPSTKMASYGRPKSLNATSALLLSHGQEPTSATAPGRGHSGPFSRLSRPAAAAPPLLCPGASVRSANGLCERSPECPGAGGRRPSPRGLSSGPRVSAVVSPSGAPGLALRQRHWPPGLGGAGPCLVLSWGPALQIFGAGFFTLS